MSFCSFFFSVVNENAENNLMVLFVRAANKEKLPMGKQTVYFTYLVDFCTIVALVGVM